MRVKLLIAVALVACGAVALTGVAGARSAAATTLTFKYNGDGFEGKVKSPKTKCVKNRKVKVFKLKHGTATKVFTETSDNFGNWDTGTSGQEHGKFYAHVARTTDCFGVTTKRIKIG